MSKEIKIYVAGHRGLAGSAICRALLARGYRNLLVRTHTELDLTDQRPTFDFLKAQRPDVVVIAAARVGGIWANYRFPAEFIQQNLAITLNLIHGAFLAGVKRLLFLGSSCIYPRDCPQPMREEMLLTGPLEMTNRPYAVAKIAGIELCWAYNRQYGTRYLALQPTNLYGPGDNYHPEHSHVIPALLRRFHEAKTSNLDRATIWGTGTPRREFLYADDLGDACAHLLEQDDDTLAPLFNDQSPPLLNVGSGEEVSIAELARLVADTVGFRGAIEFDPSRPDGTPRKLLDCSRLQALGWRAKTTLPQGLQSAYKDMLEYNRLNLGEKK